MGASRLYGTAGPGASSVAWRAASVMTMCHPAGACAKPATKDAVVVVVDRRRRLGRIVQLFVALPPFTRSSMTSARTAGALLCSRASRTRARDDGRAARAAARSACRSRARPTRGSTMKPSPTTNHRRMDARPTGGACSFITQPAMAARARRPRARARAARMRQKRLREGAAALARARAAREPRPRDDRLNAEHGGLPPHVELAQVPRARVPAAHRGQHFTVVAPRSPPRAPRRAATGARRRSARAARAGSARSRRHAATRVRASAARHAACARIAARAPAPRARARAQRPRSPRLARGRRARAPRATRCAASHGAKPRRETPPRQRAWRRARPAGRAAGGGLDALAREARARHAAWMVTALSSRSAWHATSAVPARRTRPRRCRRRPTPSDSARGDPVFYATSRMPRIPPGVLLESSGANCPCERLWAVHSSGYF